LNSGWYVGWRSWSTLCHLWRRLGCRIWG